MLKNWQKSIRLRFPNKTLLLSLIVFLAFFLASFSTLSDYGPNWDSAIHFIRGQAYFRYLLTRKTDYQDLEKAPQIRRSYYQTGVPSTLFFLERDSGHPPLNDILAATFNYIFYQKLGVMGDIESYHLFILFTSSVLVGVVFLFALEEYGLFAGIASALSLALYPLFLAESHFNIKDPVGAAFYGLTIYAFFKGVKLRSWHWFLASSVFCGMALGTKFNIVFIPLILLPWLITRGIKRSLSKKILISLFFYPFVAFLIFFLFWPYLWQDPFANFLTIVGYYKKIGGSSNPSFSLYPIKTIFYTTPLVILFFFLCGVVSTTFLLKKEKEKTSSLFLLWFLVPVIRVSLPGSSIYGGVRQIMEFAPAMALLAGFGADTLRRLLRRFITYHYRLSFIILLLSFLPITLKMAQIHPNQNVYFNPLIGGLKGAKEKNYPYWGLTLGSVYKQGINWLNQNAERGAKVALVIGTGANIPRIYLREDLRFDNQFWSGYKKEGEYLIEVVHQDWIKVYWFCGEYVDRILEPVYELKVEGVPILKIWKNDLAHTKPEFRNEQLIEEKKISWKKEANSLIIEVGKPVAITRIMIDYIDFDCLSFDSAQFSFSWDKNNWELLKEPIKEYMREKGRITYPVAGKQAKYINFEIVPQKECPFLVKKIRLSGVYL